MSIVARSGKAIIIIYYEYVFVNLGIQHAKRISRIMLSPCPLRFYRIFPHYPTIFGSGGRGGTLLNIKCVFRFSLQFFSVMFLIIRPKRDIIMNVLYIVLRVKLPLFLSGCNET